MTEEEIYNILRKNLSIRTNINWIGSEKVLSVKLLFNDKEICADKTTLEYENRY